MVNQNEILSLLSEKARNTSVNFANLLHDQPLRAQGIDSLDISLFLFAVEEKYSISIPTSKVGDLLSINDFLDYINSNIG